MRSSASQQISAEFLYLSGHDVPLASLAEQESDPAASPFPYADLTTSRSASDDYKRQTFRGYFGKKFDVGGFERRYLDSYQHLKESSGNVYALAGTTVNVLDIELPALEEGLVSGFQFTVVLVGGFCFGTAAVAEVIKARVPESTMNAAAPKPSAH